MSGRPSHAKEGVTHTGGPPTPSRRLIGIAEVCWRTGRGRSAIRRYVMSPTLGFPQPVRLGERDRGWYEDEVDEWISSRPRVGSAR